MFGRVDNYFVILTNNLMALEALTEFIYEMLKSTYFIQIELFQNMTLYRIYVPMRSDYDKKVIRQINEYLTLRHITLLKEG